MYITVKIIIIIIMIVIIVIIIIIVVIIISIIIFVDIIITIIGVGRINGQTGKGRVRQSNRSAGRNLFFFNLLKVLKISGCEWQFR